MPVNPNTANQVEQRAVLAAASQAWRGLTAAQRTAWINLGLQITRQDSLGQTYTLTGIQAYSSYYRNVTLVGGTPSSDAPSLSAPAAIASVTVTATGT